HRDLPLHSHAVGRLRGSGIRRHLQLRPQGTSMSPTEPNLIDQLVAAAMEAGSIPGIALAVVQDGQLTLAKGYGLANLEHAVPATEHTVFRIASITKTFTATAVMMLWEQRQVDLN